MSAGYDASGGAVYEGSRVFLGAAAWVQQLLTGSLATMIAVVAIAAVGLAMLSGRVSVRRGATLVLGCFVLFGASSVARGLVSRADAMPRSEPMRVKDSTDLQEQLSVSEAKTDVGDPYAGAAFQR